jgi:hypothetical protein
MLGPRPPAPTPPHPAQSLSHSVAQSLEPRERVDATAAEPHGSYRPLALRTRVYEWTCRFSFTSGRCDGGAAPLHSLPWVVKQPLSETSTSRRATSPASRRPPPQPDPSRPIPHPPSRPPAPSRSAPPSPPSSPKSKLPAAAAAAAPSTSAAAAAGARPRGRRSVGRAGRRRGRPGHPGPARRAPAATPSSHLASSVMVRSPTDPVLTMTNQACACLVSAPTDHPPHPCARARPAYRAHTPGPESTCRLALVALRRLGTPYPISWALIVYTCTTIYIQPYTYTCTTIYIYIRPARRGRGTGRAFCGPSAQGASRLQAGAASRLQAGAASRLRPRLANHAMLWHAASTWPVPECRPQAPTAWSKV